MDAQGEGTQELFRLARDARDRAYSPYSGHRVGAAIRLESGEAFAGCNVENSSYGATNCAERVAIQSAVASLGKVRLAEVVVVTDASPPWPPCGLCRQVIAEFGRGCRIVSANLQGELQSMTFDELFPRAFTPEHLGTH
jgi:cytidine deaminase